MNKFFLAAFLCVGILTTGSLTAQGIDGDVFTKDLTGIAEKADLPGAYKGKIAIEFANYFNGAVQKYPAEVVKINALTNRVADAFSIKFTLNGKTMESAQFPTPNPPKQAESEPEILREPEVEPVLIYKVVESMPRFPGCEDMNGSNQEKYDCAVMKMLTYVYGNLQYPEQAKSNGVEGTVAVEFIVRKDGSLTDINVVQSLGYGCDEEGRRIIESMNHMDEKWRPGIQRGTAVIVQYTLPIKFKLQ